jgi:hypothetical protein
MSKIKMMMIAWVVVGAFTIAGVYAVTLLPQPAYAAANC